MPDERGPAARSCARRGPGRPLVAAVRRAALVLVAALPPVGAGAQAPASPADTAAVLRLVLDRSRAQWHGGIRFQAQGNCRAPDAAACARHGFWQADSARGQALLAALAPPGTGTAPLPVDSSARAHTATFLVGAPRFRGDTAWVHVGQRGGQRGPGGGGFAADWWAVLVRAAAAPGWRLVGWHLARVT